MIKTLAWVCLFLGPLSCGLSVSDEQLVAVEMYSVFKVPDGATGNASPTSYKLTFTNLILTGTDGSQLEFTPDSPEEKTIIDRPQVLFAEDASAYEGVSFSSAELVFEPDLTAEGRYDSYDLSLSSSTLTYNTAEFSIATGKSLTFIVTANWLNTVTRDRDAGTEVVVEPSFDIEVDD